MSANNLWRRTPHTFDADSAERAVEEARRLNNEGDPNAALDLYEAIAATFPRYADAAHLEAYKLLLELKPRGRYELYQSRLFDFPIRQGDKVLDVGSGNVPFPRATALADLTTSDHGYGRAGEPFKEIDGVPVYECAVERMPFEDDEFDFVYCSHTLEHVDDPERACREISRVGKRGYAETPTPAKDLWFATARSSNHKWKVELDGDALRFTPYDEREIDGIGSDVLMRMHTAPQSDRERIFAGLSWLKPQFVNTMIAWEGELKCRVESGKPSIAVKEPTIVEKSEPKNAERETLKFVQAHTFYAPYLDNFYARYPRLRNAPRKEQMRGLIKDGFSGIHMVAPHLKELGYDAELIVANDLWTQKRWMEENLPDRKLGDREQVEDILVEQLDALAPDVLYLSEPISLDSRLVRRLKRKPRLVIGWRASDILPRTDWSEFDVMLSGLKGVRLAAIEFGAKAAEDFYPGFTPETLDELGDVPETRDLVFSGSWTPDQHKRRNDYLDKLASFLGSNGYQAAYFINGEVGDDRPAKKFVKPPVFGVEMYRALKSGGVVFDARCDMFAEHPKTKRKIDIAGEETLNMRLFEATGVGAFLLTERYSNLTKYFEPGKEIETFADEAELVDKVRYYLERPEKRAEIAKRGQERTLRDHSMDKRAKAFDEIVRSHLAKKERASEPTPSVTTEDADAKVLELFKKANMALQKENAEKAFELINEAKAYRRPMEHLDLLRAAIFLRMGQIDAARQAALEELSRFPENENANVLLKRLPKSRPQPVPDDAEFAALLERVRPHSMLGEARLFSLFELAKKIGEANVPGAVVECGVARGGSLALLSNVANDRKVYGFDTFEGMPQPTEEDTLGGVPANQTGWGAGTCDGPTEHVRMVVDKIGAGQNVELIPGFFQETLPEWKGKIGAIALLHFDGDWYESAKTVFDHLYDSVAVGGYIQIDDYSYWEGCRKAVDEFRSKRGLEFDLRQIDGSAVRFRKTE